MRALEEYELGERIAHPRGAVTYRGKVRTSGSCVLITVVSADVAGLERATDRYRREYELGRAIAHESVVRYLDFRAEPDGALLIQEDFGGAVLEHVAPGQGFDIALFLDLALQLSESLAAIHDRGLVHAAVRPHGIFVNLHTKTAKLAALGSAFDFYHEVSAGPGETDYDELAYQAPEESGRMAEVVDFRSDLYSLGATYYRMLAGVAPFRAADALALTHRHIAGVHEPLEKRRAGVPLVLSYMVDRLLAKDPRDRYQSAHGLAADLARCRRQLDDSGQIPRFTLGEHDRPARIEFPQRLYGRESESTRLFACFEAVHRGATRVVWVKCEAGGGKTALVRALARQVADAGGIFLCGDFAQRRADEPYAALSAAVNEWVQKVLTEPADTLANIRQQLIERLGANLGLLMDVLPALEQIVGEQARGATRQVAAESVFATRTRLQFAFMGFLSLLADAEHPLVLFLDDLQWASSALTQLLTSALTGAALQHLLFIGAYRIEEVDAQHSVSTMELALAHMHVSGETIELTPLSQADVAELLADTLRTDVAAVAELAELIHEKAGGNPLATRTLIEDLEVMGHLRPRPPHGRWAWDIGAIRTLPPSVNTLGSLERKLERMPAPTREVLWVASRVGSVISVPMLAALVTTSIEETWAALLPAIRDRLLEPLPDLEATPAEEQHERASYPALRFSHDRVRQACAALSVAGDVRALQGRIGRVLLETLPEKQREERIFAIVDHLNQGPQPKPGTDEALRLAALNAKAGQRARATAAYKEGLGYYERALALLSLPAAWSTAHDLVFELHMGLAECAGVMEQTARARSTFEQVRAHVRTLPARVALLRAQVALESSVTAFGAVLRHVREALAELGVELPGPGEASACVASFDRARLERTLEDHTLEALVAWREAESDHAQAVLELLALAVPAAYVLDKSLMDCMVLMSLQYSLDHGFTKSTSYSFVSYALHRAARLDDPARAVAFGQVALRLAERFPSADQGRLHYVFGLFLCHWREHADASVAHLRIALRQALEMGDVFHARLAAMMLPLFLTQTGKNVGLVREETEHGLYFIHRGHIGFEALGKHTMFEALSRCLSGSNADPTQLELPDMPEKAVVEYLAARSKTMLATFHVIKLELLVLHQRWSDAVALVQRCDALICEEVGAMWFGVEYVYLSALAIVALRQQAPDRASAALAALLEQRRKWLRSWAALCPVNFEHRRLLLEAELLDLEGERARAAELFAAAIEAAVRSSYTHEVALTYERAALFYERIGHEADARSCLEQANEAYLHWGAFTKSQELLEQHRALMHGPRPVRGQELDLISVIKASQALASETRLYDLVQQVLQISAENAGAERAHFVFAAGDQLRVAACWPPCHPPIDPEIGAPLADAHEVSAGIVRYVLRTRESLVLDDAAAEGAFTEEPSVRALSARSILAMPLSPAKPESGVLYLENRLTPRAFMRERLALLEMLIRQASILIDNARFLQRTQRLNAALQAENLQRERAEAELRASERRATGFLERLPVGVLIFAPDKQLHFMNGMAKQILGGADEAQAARAFFEMYRPEQGERVGARARPLNRALEGEYVWDDDLEVRRDGAAIPLTVWASPFRDSSGRVEFAIVAFQDVSDAKRAAVERAQLEERVRQAEKMESIGRLAAGVAHDFNNLLVPIQGFSGLAAQAEQQQERVEYLGHVQEAAGQAAELTRSLLALARQQVLHMSPLNLSAEMDALQRLLDSVVRENIEFVRDLAADLPSVRADRSQLRQVIMNLVVNACDAMPNGGRLVVSTRRVLLREPLSGVKEIPAGDYVVLSVADTGEGMSPATQARIFEPFYTTKELGKGVGLGLALVFGIVDQHHGYMRLRSALGQGTTFEVWLPSVADQATALTPADAQDYVRRPTDRLLLVVEDDAGVRQFIQEVLQSSGYEYLVAESPSRAFELIERSKRRPDAVITDVVLPEMNGRELFDKLRQRVPGLRGLFISGYAANILSENDKLAPGTRFLAKPFSLVQLRKSLDELLA